MRDTMLTGVDCALLLFGLDDQASFSTAKAWHSVLTTPGEGAQPGAPATVNPPMSPMAPGKVFFVGTKSDLVPLRRCNFLKGASQWCRQHGSPLLATSSFEGEGIPGLLRLVMAACWGKTGGLGPAN